MVNTLVPFTRDLFDFDRMVDRVFQEAFQPMRTIWSQSMNGIAQPIPLDVYATDEEAVLLAAVPGMRPEDLDLTVHQNTVTIHGRVPNLAETQQGQNVTWYARELWSGEFRRSVTLPFPVNVDQVQATFENGILKVTLPKAEHARPRRIEISSGQSQPHAISESAGTAS